MRKHKNISFSDDEEARIKKIAKETGLNFSSFVRSSVLEKTKRMEVSSQ